MQLADLVKAADSLEFHIFKHMKRVAQAYVDMLNAPNETDAKTSLKEMHSAASDIERMVRGTLYRWGCPPELDINLSKRVMAITAQRCSVLDAHCLNMHQVFIRFIHSKKPENKVKELTSFYHLVKDLVEITGEAKADNQRARGI